ncbi:type II toxin-antitoxin system prevent-host-death family antitoxin [Patescibacteria group bacterium]|nr:type II toxin-antitoxin system prevent-host-death family antitoxin [Patescibacteria group bacterium]
MRIINMYQAKTNLSALVESALAGNDVVIARAGKPLVRLVPYTSSMKPRKPGLFKGKIQIPDNFNQESQEIISLFTGGKAT